ncbi:hypothetical protein Psuf_077610 [Phytohabitans suffuscus]|uniref:JmjC domain-containing protein n=1 Tax=Phytohabitans suffuscus TaxID=624315 RepID=A0A6F8YWY1_9ACTN|nr:hypothetical protein Psuf_077610 [Phytohabitans suffuscus]
MTKDAGTAGTRVTAGAATVEAATTVDSAIAGGGVAAGGAPGGSARPALARCVAVEPAKFAGAYWGRAPLLSRAADLGGPDGFRDLLSPADADELLSRRGLRTPFLRVARDGEVLPAYRFAGGGGAGAEVPDQVLDERVLALYADGATLVLQGLHRLWPPLVDLARELGGQLGQPLQVNAYLTPAASQGFATHYDTHDVFVLQVDGRKRWRVHEPVLPDPWNASRGAAVPTRWPPSPRARPRSTRYWSPATRCTCRVAGCTAPPPRTDRRCTSRWGSRR